MLKDHTLSSQRVRGGSTGACGLRRVDDGWLVPGSFSVVSWLLFLDLQEADDASRPSGPIRLPIGSAPTLVVPQPAAGHLSRVCAQMSGPSSSSRSFSLCRPAPNRKEIASSGQSRCKGHSRQSPSGPGAALGCKRPRRRCQCLGGTLCQPDDASLHPGPLPLCLDPIPHMSHTRFVARHVARVHHNAVSRGALHSDSGGKIKPRNIPRVDIGTHARDTAQQPTLHTITGLGKRVTICHVQFELIV